MSWHVILGRVESLMPGYVGDKFHALLCDPSYALSEKKRLDMSKPLNMQIETVGDLMAAYHSLQHWGDTGFMGKAWDTDVAFDPDTWSALAEHLYPGAFGMAFASARGWHRLAVAIEDAGLRIHPSIFGYCYGSGLPKATRIDTQVDKAAGAERDIIGYGSDGIGRMNIINQQHGYRPNPYSNGQDGKPITAPATPLARAWTGHRYGLQALKPALEPIIVFQKPYDGKPVECVTRTGAGALWIDGGRIRTTDQLVAGGCMRANTGDAREGKALGMYQDGTANTFVQNPRGRWPANFCLVHSPGCRRVGTKRVKPAGGDIKAGSRGSGPRQNDIYSDDKRPRGEWTAYKDPDGTERVDAWECVPECAAYRLGVQSGVRTNTRHMSYKRSHGEFIDSIADQEAKRWWTQETGTAARFFFNAGWEYEIAERLAEAEPVSYEAKAAKAERNRGLRDFYWRIEKTAAIGFARISRPEWDALREEEEEERIFKETGRRKRLRARGNIHPTVKPISLCRWLATLLLPPPEYAPRRVLVPFSGSGSEMIGAGLAGWETIVGIEMERDYAEIAEARLSHWLDRPRQGELGL